MTLRRDWIGSPNYSSRGSGVRLVVLHTAEGSRTYQSLGSFFADPDNQVSSHTGIDDTPGVIGEYVHRDKKAWTQANANPYSVATELCAFASWSAAEWAKHPTMLSNCAQWIAEECAAFGIPLRRLTAAQAQGGQAGVCQHGDLGAIGGSHWDCGPGFPMDQVMSMAAGGAVPAPTPERKGAHVWTLMDQGSGGYWVADATGGVYAYDGAPYLGGCNNPTYNKAGWQCAGLAEFSNIAGAGYVLTLDTGAPGGDRYARYRFPRDASARV